MGDEHDLTQSRNCKNGQKHDIDIVKFVGDCWSDIGV